jgi:hypothetical protein
VTILFKEYGVRLNFKPTILDEQHIRLELEPEVSSLDFGNAIVFSGFTIPALRVRRARTGIELQDGQSFGIAGLLDNSEQKSLAKIPVLSDVPILGNLFKSKSFQRNESELLFIVTAKITKPMNPDAVPQIKAVDSLKGSSPLGVETPGATGSGGATSSGATSGGATSSGATSSSATSSGATGGGATSGGAPSSGATSVSAPSSGATSIDTTRSDTTSGGVIRGGSEKSNVTDQGDKDGPDDSRPVNENGSKGNSAAPGGGKEPGGGEPGAGTDNNSAPKPAPTAPPAKPALVRTIDALTWRVWLPAPTLTAQRAPQKD